MKCTECLKIRILEKCHFSRFLKFDLPTSNSIFSAPKWQNFSVYAEFPEFSENCLTFYHIPFRLGVIVKKTMGTFFGGTPVLYIFKGSDLSQGYQSATELA